MGGRGGKGRARNRAPQPMPKDPPLPPDATARPDDPEVPGSGRDDRPDPARYQPGVTPPADPGPVPQTAEEIDAHIADTAKSFERDPGDYINLANVRAALHPGLDRAAVDAALTRLNSSRGAIFTPDDDQEAMAQVERDAAVRIGNQDNHFICFDDHTRGDR